MARAMKDSGIPWVGEIPEEWETNKLKYLATYNDDVLGEDIDPLFEFDYIDIGSVEYGKGITQLQRMTFSNAPSRARRMVKENDVILSTVRTYLKAVAMIRSFEIPQVASTGFIVLRAIEGEIIPSFLHYAVLSNAFISLVEASSTGISYPAINATEVAEMSIPVPPIEIQRSIAQFLDNECARIDAVIEQTRASIEEYKKLKQAVITQAVTKGIRPNRPMKDSGIEWIGEIQSNYCIYRMKHLITEPLMYGANESGIPYEDNLPRYIRITDITMDGKLKDSGKLSLPEDLAKEYLLDDGDVLFARSGATVGKAFIYKKEYGKSAFAGYLIRARFNALIIPELLFYYTQSSIYEEWKNQIFIQSTIQNIGADRYNQLPVVVSPIEEQHEILSYIHSKASEIDRLLQDKESLIDDLESYKKTMIFEYVTGKKEVP